MNKFLIMILRALGLALLVGPSFVVVSPTYASTINVGCDVNELVNAINTANANADADTLELAQDCAYTLTAVDNSDVTYGPNGLPIITSDITINGNHATIARDANAPAFRLWQINPGATLTLNDLTLSGGAPGASNTNDGFSGGAIYNRGTCILNHTTLEHNRAGDGTPDPPAFMVGGDGGDGGAVFNAANAMLTVSSGILNHNRAGQGADKLEYGGRGGDGGAIANYGTAQINDTTIQENESGKAGASPVAPHAGGGGGGIFNAGTLQVARSTFTHNRSGDGGNRQTVGTVAGNGGSGGGLDNTGAAVLENSTFFENATGLPGVLAMTATLSEADPRYGKSGNGGGIANAGTLTLIHVTLSRNSVGATTLPGMRGQGGNLANASGTVTLKNTLIANSALGKNCSGAFSDGGGNIRFPKTDTTCIGAYGAPKLGPLQDNGGPTNTLALAPNSRAINHGLDANCLATDQRGVARPQGKHCDSGAFELEPPTAVTLVAPPDNQKLEQVQVNLKWTAAERVVNYQVIVRMDSVTGKKIANEKVTTLKYQTPVLERGHWYYWHIKACSQVGCTNSTVWRFRVK
jgi:hypothetical protein